MCVRAQDQAHQKYRIVELYLYSVEGISIPSAHNYDERSIAACFIMNTSATLSSGTNHTL